jgi:hypothetical protein
MEKKWEYINIVHELFIDFKKSSDSFRREVLHTILIEFGVSIRQPRFIEMGLNEMYNKVYVCKLLCDNFPIQNYLKQGDVLSPLLFNFAL